MVQIRESDGENNFGLFFIVPEHFCFSVEITCSFLF
jgi:hypothetical protein